MNRRGTPANLLRRNPNPLSDDQRAELVRLAASGASYAAMAGAIARPLGTVKTALFHMRNQGIVARRYTIGAWVDA
jgi:DNA-directed RNA polymerase specialized sigma24 family protein